MDENNNNVNETDIPENSTVPETNIPESSTAPETDKDDSSKPVSAFEMPGDNRINAAPVPKTDSYSNVVSEPAEFSTGFGIASLVMGILSILTCCCCGLGILMSILGIIFGCIQPKDEFGKKPGIAVAGIATSIIGILSGVLILVLFVITGMFA